MRYVIAAALVASTALAAPAFAQEVNPVFTGPRIAVLGGYDGIKPGSDGANIEGVDQTVDGFLYGVEAGYDFAFGGALVGADLELTDSTGKVETNRVNPNSFGFGEVSTGRDIYLGLRAGVMATPSTLVYAKGGYTNARLNLLGGDGTTVDRRQNFEVDGFRLGAGAEQAISANTFAKVEYRYSNYSNANFRFADGATTRDFGVDTDRHQVVAGVGMRF